MHAMHMPRFTAETSIYETTRHYRSTTTRNYRSGAQAIISQIRVGGEGLSVQRFDRGIVSVPPKTIGPVNFQCGWNAHTLKSECKCSGDRDCNNMFSSGFCGANASCDTGQGTCTCELAW